MGIHGRASPLFVSLPRSLVTCRGWRLRAGTQLWIALGSSFYSYSQAPSPSLTTLQRLGSSFHGVVLAKGNLEPCAPFSGRLFCIGSGRAKGAGELVWRDWHSHLTEGAGPRLNGLSFMQRSLGTERLAHFSALFCSTERKTLKENSVYLECSQYVSFFLWPCLPRAGVPKLVLVGMMAPVNTFLGTCQMFFRKWAWPGGAFA